jgi:hypothetical protein
MDTRQQQSLQTFRQILDWSAKRPNFAGATAGEGSTSPVGATVPASPIALQLGILRESVSTATARASEHEGLDREVLGLSAEIKSLRKGLIQDEMVHVATIARTAIPDVVRMTEALRTPRRTRRTETLLASAEAMAVAGQQYSEELVGSGLSADFPSQLRNKAAALQDAIDARRTTAVNRRGASKGFVEAIARGRKAVDRLTVVVKRELRDDPTTVSEWMQLRKLRKVAVRPAATPGTPSAPVVTTPGQEEAAA